MAQEAALSPPYVFSKFICPPRNHILSTKTFLGNTYSLDVFQGLIPPRTSKTDYEITIQTLRTRFPNIPIVAADLSPGMLEKIEKKLLPQVKCQVLDAIDLSPIVDRTFTHSLSTFMIQFTPDPFGALKEMYRVTKSGGTLGLCMWGELCFDAPWEETVRQFEPDYTYPHTW